MSTKIKTETMDVSDKEEIDEDLEVHEAKKLKMTETIQKHKEIAGVKVQFPLEPYKCQMAIMHKVIQGCKNREHCLLESPTGSGKTLALLCSSLAWQEWYNAEILKERSADSDVTTGNACKESCANSPTGKSVQSSSVTHPSFCSKSDFEDIDFEEAYMNISDDNCDDLPKKAKIFYGTRTHRQITQVVKEFGRTVYSNKKMTILSSREHSCIQDSTRNKTELCNELLDPSKHVDGCSYYNEKSKCNMIAFKSRLPPVWDIEDLIKFGKESNACPYFAARELMEEADIIFCPYNYLIDPRIREGMHLNLTGHVIILDEAHNMEDTCCDIGTLRIQEDEVEHAIRECKKLTTKTANYIYDTIEQFMSLMLNCMRNVELRQCDSVMNQHASFSCKKLLELFKNNGIDEHRCTEFKEAAKEALIKMKETKEYMKFRFKERSLSNTIISHFLQIQLENLLQLLEIIDSPEWMNHYAVSMTSIEKKKDYNVDSQDWISVQDKLSSMKVLKLLCLNPGLIFRQIANQARSIILTSGTLAPMESFASELKTNFKYNFQGIHVIPKENIYVNCISQGPNNFNLTANFRTVNSARYQQEVGLIIQNICETVPHGVLCFFTSYRVLHLMMRSWKSHKIWQQIARVKDIFIEPNQQSQLQHIMKQFRDTIRETSLNPIHGITGCLLLGVMRGKLAEGEDFKDEEARCVITVGLPYTVKHTEVELKMNYNNAHKSEGLLNGEQWYNIQAFRALNQALGRCIRHANDWGAVLLIDDRFEKSVYREKLPKWVKAVFSVSIDRHTWRSELQSFVCRHKTITHNK